jgi:EAL domain-containing protein (putative c-di-GMP-specific phosphodiesterase class I)/GGDEF domain-containing protein
MSSDSLIQALPDLIVRLSRDGVVLAMQGGQSVGSLRPPEPSVGKRAEEIWPMPVATLVRQLARKAIAGRSNTEARFQDRGREYEAQVSVQGPDRVLCVLRAIPGVAAAETDGTPQRTGSRIDRRGFMRRLKESVSGALLRETPMAVAVIQVEGIADIAHAIAPTVSEQVMTTAIRRLPRDSDTAADADPDWFLGQLGDSVLAVAIASSRREAIEARVAALCSSLREPVALGANVFHLSAFAGAALLGEDATSARTLIEQARSASTEARRRGSARVCFFSETVSVKSLARLDIVHELREAIAQHQIGVHYAGRYDLANGRLTACVAQMLWNHPLRGPIPQGEFLRVAESTGMALALAQALFQRLREDFARLRAAWPAGARLSVGVLRHHLSHESFVPELEHFLADRAVPAESLELRVAESDLGVRPPDDFRPLTQRGAELVVEDFGSGGASLAWLARAPVSALQLDATWTSAVHTDIQALRVCRAAIGLARALRLRTIAARVDDPQQCKNLLDMGFDQGFGQLFPALALDAPLTREARF